MPFGRAIGHIARLTNQDVSAPPKFEAAPTGIAVSVRPGSRVTVNRQFNPEVGPPQLMVDAVMPLPVLEQIQRDPDWLLPNLAGRHLNALQQFRTKRLFPSQMLRQHRHRSR